MHLVTAAIAVFSSLTIAAAAPSPANPYPELGSLFNKPGGAMVCKFAFTSDSSRCSEVPCILLGTRVVQKRVSETYVGDRCRARMRASEGIYFMRTG
jgi:hypothetical protein